MNQRKSLDWILLLILLSENVIGHVSDGSSPGGGGGSSSSTLISGTASFPESTTTLTSFSPTPAPIPTYLLEPPKKQYPYIEKEASPNVTALVGKNAYLNCRVKNIGDKTVSWVRHRDIHLLTVGRYTYTTDQRFRAIHQPQTDDYTLVIKYPQQKDSGIYECQVSATPHLSHFICLTIVEAETEVLASPDLFIDTGSTINLTCVVKYSPVPPSYIIWNHNDAIISYISPRGGITIVTEKGETTISYLLIQKAKSSDSGRYSCNPSNAASHHINVHVLQGEQPAAMQTGGQMSEQISLSWLIFFSTVLKLVSDNIG